MMNLVVHHLESEPHRVGQAIEGHTLRDLASDVIVIQPSIPRRKGCTRAGSSTARHI